jgi:DNA-binding CsgD family transcriptional regulator
MDALSADDYRKVLSAIEILGSATDYVDFPVRALQAVGAVIDVDFSSYAEVDLKTGWNRFLVRPAPAELEHGSSAYQRLARRFGNHPILAHHLTANARSRPGRDAFVERLRFLGMVGNCCGEAELLLNLDLTLVNAERRMIGISINRGISDFQLVDRARLMALRSHLLAAYRVAAQLADRAQPPASSAALVVGLPLTSRESEVLYWVAMGKTNDEVGTIVGARPMTVKKHLEHIYDKLGVPNRTAAASAYRGHGVPGMSS